MMYSYSCVLDKIEEALKFLDEDDPYYERLEELETDLIMEENFDAEEFDEFLAERMEEKK